MLKELLLDREYKDYCLSLCGNMDDANDLLSEIISKVAESPQKFRKAHSNGYYKQYIFRSIYNHFCNEKKKPNQLEGTYESERTNIPEHILQRIENQIEIDTHKKKLHSGLQYLNFGQRSSDTTPPCFQGKQE